MSQSSKVFTQDLSLSLHNLIKGLDCPDIQSVDALLVNLVGNINASLILRRLIYWFPRAKKFGDWVYKSWRNLNAETGLSQGQIKRVLRNGYLEAIGIERTLMKANGAPTNHYRLNPERFLQVLADFFGETVERIRELMQSDHRQPPAKQSASVGQGKPNHAYAGMSWSDLVTDDPIQCSQDNPFNRVGTTQSNSHQATQSITSLNQQPKIYNPKTTSQADLFSFSRK